MKMTAEVQTAATNTEKGLILKPTAAPTDEETASQQNPHDDIPLSHASNGVERFRSFSCPSDLTTDANRRSEGMEEAFVDPDELLSALPSQKRSEPPQKKDAQNREEDRRVKGADDEKKRDKKEKSKKRERNEKEEKKEEKKKSKKERLPEEDIAEDKKKKKKKGKQDEEEKKEKKKEKKGKKNRKEEVEGDADEDESSGKKKKSKKKDKKDKKKEDDKKKKKKEKKKKRTKDGEAEEPELAVKKVKASEEEAVRALIRKKKEHPARYGWPDRVATEEDAGIKCYLTESPGFDGVVKQRYADFVVHEIDLNKKLVELTSEAIPDDVAAAPVPAAAPEPSEQLEMLKTRLGEKYAAIEKALEEGQKGSITIEDALTKEERTAIHQAVKVVWEGRVDSFTSEGKVSLAFGGLKVKGDYKATTTRRSSATPVAPTSASSEWPKGRPQFLRFVLLKENLETNNAIDLISKGCGLNSKQFMWAGTKDKRSISVQHVTIRKVAAARIAEGAKKLKGIRVGNFEYVDKESRLGQSLGNRFDVVLRFVSAGDEDLEDAVAQIRKLGFVNFFGLQRFGTTSSWTHLIGLAILRGDFENAVDLVLSPSCPSWMKERNAKKALGELDKWCFGERAMLQLLEKSPSNFMGALHRLPSNLRSLYLHAYQAYVWNVGASARMAKGPKDKPQVGDLVLVGEGQDIEDAVDEGTSDMTFNAKVKVLTEADLDKYSIADVLIPIPGPSVTLPNNAAATAMLEVLERDGVPLSSWKASDTLPVKGGYRRVLCKPENVSFQILHYNDETVPLILTDADKLDGKEPPQSVAGGKFKALRLSLDLPSGSYATMFFRELQKRDSGQNYQVQMKAQWEKKKNPK